MYAENIKLITNYKNLENVFLKLLNLKALDLKDPNLENIDFKKEFLKLLNLKISDLNHLNLENLDFKKAFLKLSDLGILDLKDFDLENLDFKKEFLKTLSVNYSKLKNLDLENLDLENLDLENLGLENLNLENNNIVIFKDSFTSNFCLKKTTFETIKENRCAILQYNKAKSANKNTSSLIINLNNLSFIQIEDIKFINFIREELINKHNTKYLKISLDSNNTINFAAYYSEYDDDDLIFNSYEFELQFLQFFNKFLENRLIDKINSKLLNLYNFEKNKKDFNNFPIQIADLLKIESETFLVLRNKKTNDYNVYTNSLDENGDIITEERIEFKDNLEFIMQIYRNANTENSYVISLNLDIILKNQDTNIEFAKFLKKQILNNDEEGLKIIKIMLEYKIVTDISSLCKDISIQTLFFINNYIRNTLIEDLKENYINKINEKKHIFQKFPLVIAKIANVNSNNFIIFFNNITEEYITFIKENNDIITNKEIENKQKTLQNSTFIIGLYYINVFQNRFNKKAIITINLDYIKKCLRDGELAKFLHNNINENEIDSGLENTDEINSKDDELNLIQILVDRDDIVDLTFTYENFSEELLHELNIFIKENIFEKIKEQKERSKIFNTENSKFNDLKREISILINRLYQKYNILYDHDTETAIIFNTQTNRYCFCNNKIDYENNPHLQLFLSFTNKNQNIKINCNFAKLNFENYIKNYIDINDNNNFLEIIENTIKANDINFTLNTGEKFTKKLNINNISCINNFLLFIKDLLSNNYFTNNFNYVTDNIENIEDILTKKDFFQSFINVLEGNLNLFNTFNTKFNQEIFDIFKKFLHSVEITSNNNIIIALNRKEVDKFLANIISIKNQLLEIELYDDNYNILNFIKYLILVDNKLIINNLKKLKETSVLLNKSLFDLEFKSLKRLIYKENEPILVMTEQEIFPGPNKILPKQLIIEKLFSVESNKKTPYNEIIDIIIDYSHIIKYDLFYLLGIEDSETFSKYIKILITYNIFYKNYYFDYVKYNDDCFTNFTNFLNKKYDNKKLDEILDELKFIYSNKYMNFITFDDIINNIDNFELFNKKIAIFLSCKNKFLHSILCEFEDYKLDEPKIIPESPKNKIERTKKLIHNTINTNLSNILFKMCLNEHDIEENQETFLENLDKSVNIIKLIYNKLRSGDEIIPMELRKSDLYDSNIINFDITLVVFLQNMVNLEEYTVFKFNQKFNENCFIFKEDCYKQLLLFLLNNKDLLNNNIIYGTKKYEKSLIKEILELCIRATTKNIPSNEFFKDMFNDIDGTSSKTFKDIFGDLNSNSNKFFRNLLGEVDNSSSKFFKDIFSDVDYLGNSFFSNTNNKIVRMAIKIYIEINEINERKNDNFVKKLYYFLTNFETRYNGNYTILKMIEVFAKITDPNKTIEKNKEFILNNVEFIDYILNYGSINILESNSIKKCIFNEKLIQNQSEILSIIKDLNMLNINCDTFIDELNKQIIEFKEETEVIANPKNTLFDLSSDNINIKKYIEIAKLKIEEKKIQQIVNVNILNDNFGLDK